MIVYKITNLENGKVYIGQTKHSLAIRWSQHKHNALFRDSKSYFHKAIRKYGPNVWKLEIVDRALSADDLSKKELYHILELKKHNQLYNLTSETAVSSRKWTETEKNTRHVPTNPQAVVCKTTGQTFSSIREAARQTGCSEGLISNVINGRKDTARGLFFEYANLDKKDKADKNRQKREAFRKTSFYKGRPVVCEQTGEVFNSIKAAARSLGVAEINMFKHLKRYRKTCRNLIFSYVS